MDNIGKQPIQWSGVFPALTTKFFPDGALDFELFYKNLDAQVNAGVDGVILGGTLGEASALRPEEKMELTRQVIKRLHGSLPVVMNIAEGSTRDAQERVREAEDAGVDGLMVLPPMRYLGDHREVVTYFSEIAASTSLPIMIYNNPVDYKTLVTLEMFDELLEHENIQAIKESTRDITNVTRLISRYGDRLKIFCGVDTLAMETLLMGSHGWVAGLVCAFPKETVTLYRLVREGRITDALALYRWFMPLLELDIHPKLVQYIKLAEQMEGIGSEYVRAPRLPLIGEERERVTSIILKAIETRPQF
jgi:1-pyrroline-4-hydroxy-2-carboxylate deaminase